MKRLKYEIGAFIYIPALALCGVIDSINGVYVVYKPFKDSMLVNKTDLIHVNEIRLINVDLMIKNSI